MVQASARRRAKVVAASERDGARRLIKAQALARARLGTAEYQAKRRAAATLQAGARRRRIVSMTNEVMAAAHMLRVGNVFIKFSQNGPPHDRWVWISPNMTELAWADPERKKKGTSSRTP